MWSARSLGTQWMLIACSGWASRCIAAIFSMSIACVTPLQGCDVALHLATAIPAPGPQRDWSRNDRIRREGTRNLLAAAQEAGMRRYAQQSITLL